MAEIDTRVDLEHTPIKLSVAIVATETHRDEWKSRLLLVHDRETDKWGPPAGSIEKINDRTELPHEAIAREWTQETTLPFRFKKGLHFIETLMSTRVGKTSIGFIYQGELPKDTITIMRWCNSIRSIADGPYSSVNYEPFTQQDFNMNFLTLSLDKLASEMKFDSE